MTAAPVEPRRWPRWWIGAVIVTGLQAGLILLLNKESEATPSKTVQRPAFRFLTMNQSTQLPVNDPTLFALPHQEGFSGGTWQKIAQPPFRPVEWLEAPNSNLLTLSMTNLGTGLSDLLANTEASSFPLIAMVEPETVFPPTEPVKPISVPSAFWIEGDLAKRKLVSGISPANLRAFTNADLLTNNTVQVVVDDRGSTLSAVLLRPYSGSAEANSNALWLAKNARFEPIPPAESENGSNAAMGLTFGNFIFHWQTLPPARTNSASAPQ